MWLPESTDLQTRARVTRRFPHSTESAPPPFVSHAIESIVALLEGDARDLTDVPLDFEPGNVLFVETNPAPVKYAAWRLGVIGSPDCRLPLAPLADSTKKAVDDVLARIGLLQAKAAE